MQRDLNSKDIELKVFASKFRALKDENATIRLQLLDPTVIKRPDRNNYDHLDEQVNDRLDQEFRRL